MLKKISYIVIVLIILVVASFLYLKNASNNAKNEQFVFTRIYENHLWGDGSGPGSVPANAEPYLQILQEYIDSPKIHTIVDLGCGDWRLMEKIKFPESKTYNGFDLVNSLIESHKIKYQKPNIHFHHIDNIKDFANQKGDLLIVKDVIQHWPNEQIQYLIQNILPNFKYAFITNDYSNHRANFDINLGDHRPIDLEAEPFYLQKNIKVLLDYSAHDSSFKRIYLLSTK